MLFNVLFQESH